jgi:hypothetical protein
VHPAEKRLNEMTQLEDMLHFPILVNAGATINVMLMIAATWYIEPRHPGRVIYWVAAVLAANLVPVALLRLTLRKSTPYPMLKDMNFFRDQHKFSDWVYMAASLNMAFWILVAWRLSLQMHSMETLFKLEAVAGLVTYSPVVIREWIGPKPPQ